MNKRRQEAIRKFYLDRRTELGLAQFEVEQKARLPKTKLCDIEAARCFPSLDEARALARVLKCSIDDIPGKVPLQAVAS